MFKGSVPGKLRGFDDCVHPCVFISHNGQVPFGLLHGLLCGTTHRKVHETIHQLRLPARRVEACDPWWGKCQRGVQIFGRFWKLKKLGGKRWTFFQDFLKESHFHPYSFYVPTWKKQTLKDWFPSSITGYPPNLSSRKAPPTPEVEITQHPHGHNKPTAGLLTHQDRVGRSIQHRHYFPSSTLAIDNIDMLTS